MQCPACRTPNREGRRFCAECGAAVAAPPASAKFASPESYIPKHLAEKILTSRTALEGKRKQVTVLFADIRGSMELLADRDPEDARKLLDPALDRMMEAVHRYEGTVNQVMGTGSWRSSARRSRARTTRSAPATLRCACRIRCDGTPRRCRRRSDCRCTSGSGCTRARSSSAPSAVTETLAAGATVPHLDLVPFDNNIALRTFAVLP